MPTKRDSRACGAVLFGIWCFVHTLLFSPLVWAETEERVISVSQFVQHPALDAVLHGFMNALDEAGVRVKYHVHNAGGDARANQEIAERIGREKPDLILAISTPSSQACLRLASTAPLLFSAVTDPVGAGLVESLAKPGRRVTGMTDISPIERQVGLIKDLQPGLKKLGTLYNPHESNSVSLVELLKRESGRQGIEIVPETVEGAEGVGAAAQKLVGRCEALYVPTDNTVIPRIESVVRICRLHRLPLYAADADSVSRGAIATLSVDYYKMGFQTARMAEKILAGKDPASMPVEALEDLRIHVNTKAADAMGVELPVSLLQAADVITDSFPESE